MGNGSLDRMEQTRGLPYAIEGCLERLRVVVVGLSSLVAGFFLMDKPKSGILTKKF